MDTNPPLQGALLLKTQLELVTGTTAVATLYGIAFSLYCLYMHASLPHLRDHGRRRRVQFMLTYSTIIMLCGLYFVVFNAWVIQDAYINHSDFPGGPLLYEHSTFRTQPVIAVGFVLQTVVDILTSAIQIWRLWVVWSGTRYARLVVMLPSLCFLGFIGLRIRTVVISVTLTSSDLTSQNIKLETAELAFRAIITILPTILIAGLLIFESRRQSRLIGKSQLLTPYMNVIAMLVESYAMESIWTIVFVILLSLRLPVAQFFSETQVSIEIIAYFLVLYRVANGRAYESQRAHESQSRRDNISSLHWNHTTTTHSSITSEADTNLHPSGNQPKPDNLQDQGSSV